MSAPTRKRVRPRHRPSAVIRWTFLAVCVLALAGCSPDAPDGRSVVTRDSAGITILETTATEQFAAPWTLGEPRVRIGRVEGEPEYLLTRVVGALLLEGDRIVVGDGGSNQVRIYDGSGRFLSDRGGEGEGPGEYEYMRGVRRCSPEGFVVFDIHWDMKWYDEGGAFEHQRPIEGLKPEPVYRFACDRQRRFAIMGWGRAVTDRIQGFYPAYDTLVVRDSAGAVVADFGEWLASERLGTARGGSRPHPFGRSTVFDLHGGRLFVGTGEHFQVQVWNLDGHLERIVRGPAIDLEITDSLRTAYADGRLASTPEERHPALRRELRDMPMPERRTAFVELRVDREGIVWLENLTVGVDEPERWSLMDPERGYLGDLALPPGHELLEAGESHVLTLHRDELDVERVVLFPLSRGS